MALLHRADITPTKLELLTRWLSTQDWFAGTSATPEQVGTYRFDDPDGEVGIETFLVRAPGGPVQQVPLTYRGEPLGGAEDFLIDTMEHSVLGRRWVYDGCGDPAYVCAVAAAILAGGTEAQEHVDVDGRLELREPSARVSGTGTSDSPTPRPAAVDVRRDGPVEAVRMADTEVWVARTPDEVDVPDGVETLQGTWKGQDEPVVLAYARRS